MSQFELKKIATDTKRTYSPADKIKFTLTFNNKSEINDDAEFEIYYFGDTYGEDNDQRIGHNVIGPLPEGSLTFDLETTSIDLTKIPIKALFGLTSILIVGKYKGEQFIRIGYVVHVTYPGVAKEVLQDSDDKPLEENEEEEIDNDEEIDQEEGSQEEDDSGIEIMEDEEIDQEEGSQEIEGEEENGAEEGAEDETPDGDSKDGSQEEETEKCEDCGDDDCKCEGDESCDEKCEECNCEDCDCGDECEDCEEGEGINLEDAIANALAPKHKRSPTPFETPIQAGVDEFIYKGINMKQSLIQMSLTDKPLVQVIEIDWNSKEQEKESEQIQESSSEVNDESKRAKIENE